MNKKGVRNCGGKPMEKRVELRIRMDFGDGRTGWKFCQDSRRHKRPNLRKSGSG